MVARVKEMVELGGKQVCLQQDTLRDSCGDRRALYLPCISVSILVVILHYCFLRYYLWGKLGKMYKGFFYIILKTGYKSTMVSKS